MTDIEELIGKCPTYTKCAYYVRTFSVCTAEKSAFESASPGDVVYLDEHLNGEYTGRRVTALVLKRTAPPEPLYSDVRALRSPRK